jgi:phosphoglycerate-specific signal transduction histidine kinase
MATVDADSGGALLLPKRITLGNLLSIAATIVTGAALAAFYYGGIQTRLTGLEHSSAQAPSTYARQADLDRALQDQRAANEDLRGAVTALLSKESETNASVAGLAASVDLLRDDIGDVRRRLEVSPARPDTGGGR